MRLFFTILIFIGAASGAKNNLEINGYVFDSISGKPIFNANIHLASDNTGSASDKDGKFIIQGVAKLPVQIKISHIGYKTVTYNIKKINSYNIYYLDKTVVEFDELVVTASRSQQYRSKSPILTEIINRSDIESSSSKNVAELLRLKSGVFIQESVGGGSNLKILGMDSKYVLILVNSQPINGKFNNRVSLDQIATENIEKIEIVKGPSSSLYGSEAMAGVVNIITNTKGIKSISAKGRIDGSSKSLSNNNFQSGDNYLAFDVQQPIKNAALRMNINTASINKNQSIVSEVYDQTKKSAFDIGGQYFLINNSALDIGYYNFSQRSERESKLNQVMSQIGRQNLIATYKNPHFTHTLRTSNYFRKYSQKRPWDSFITDEEKTSEKLVEYELKNRHQASSMFINSGVEVSQAKYQSNRIKSGNQKIDIFSLFTQFDNEHTSNISTTTGLRIDNFSNYKAVFSPRFAVMYDFNNSFKFRYSWGLGFRAPSFIEQYIDWDHEQYGYTVFGNANLKPERSNGAILSLQYDDSKTYDLNISYYITYFENLIENFTVSPGKLSYENVESATFEGIEILSRITLSEKFSTNISLNWLDNRDRMDNIIPNTVPFSFSSQAKYLSPNGIFSFNANIKIITPYTPQIYDSEQGIFIKDKNKIDQYALINLTTNIKWGKNTNYSIGVDNLTDYTNIKYGPYIGRKIYFQISSIINNRNSL